MLKLKWVAYSMNSYLSTNFRKHLFDLAVPGGAYFCGIMLNKAYRYVHIFDPDSTLDHSSLIQQFEKLYIPFTHLTQLSE